MTQEQTKSGGIIAKAIVFIVGIILAGIGTAAGYYCYLMANSTKHMEYQWLWVALSAGLCFFMLRGAWHTVFYKPESAKKRFEIAGVNREF